MTKRVRVRKPEYQMAKSKRPKTKKTKTTKAIGGRFVNSAFTCEKVLKEGLVPTFVRVIDTFNIAGPAETMEPGTIQFVLFVAFKSGDFRGEKTMLITCESPGGTNKTWQSSHTMEFKGAAAGAAVES